ncbi:MAG: ABC-2 family transporter protein [Nanoarchaeota archaeon]
MNRNLSYFWEWFIIGLKSMNEYKINIYFGIFVNIVFSILLFVFYSLLKNILPVTFGWGTPEFLFNIFWGSFFAILGGTFWFGGRLSRFLLQGDMNPILTKPLNSFLQYVLSTSEVFIFISSSHNIFFIIVIFFIYAKEIFFERLFFAILFAFFGSLFFFLANRFFDSIGFYFKDARNIHKAYHTANDTFVRFPVIIFKNWIYIIGFLAGTTYFSALPTHYLFGHMPTIDFVNIFFILIAIEIVLCFLIYLLWKIGIKKYEAYN